MKLYALIMSLLFVSMQVFASNVPGAFGVKIGTKKPCPKPISCQLYKYCAERYNNEYGTEIVISEDNEVTDLALQDELRELVLLISFYDNTGDFIVPEINPKNDNLRLPLMKEGKECVDFKLAKSIIEQHEKLNPVGRLGLVDAFNEIKKQER